VIVRANGKAKELARGTTIAQFLELAKLPAGQVVVEHNGEPRRREEYATTVLRSGDTLEVAQMVGGG